MSYNLKKENYIVETAKNGEVAIEKATKFMPNLLILDVMMPGMDGIQVAKFRSNEKPRTFYLFSYSRGEITRKSLVLMRAPTIMWPNQLNQLFFLRKLKQC
jgi:DNA-binding response OmpR family regulator